MPNFGSVEENLHEKCPHDAEVFFGQSEVNYQVVRLMPLLRIYPSSISAGIISFDACIREVNSQAYLSFEMLLVLTSD